MSKFGAIASGLLSGFGQSLSSISDDKFKAELEEARAARDRAYQLEFLEAQHKFATERLETQADINTEQTLLEADIDETHNAQRAAERAIQEERARQEKNVQYAREDKQNKIANDMEDERLNLLKQESDARLQKLQLEIDALESSNDPNQRKRANAIKRADTLQEMVTGLNKNISDMSDKITGLEEGSPALTAFQNLVDRRDKAQNELDEYNEMLNDPLLEEYRSSKILSDIIYNFPAEIVIFGGKDPKKGAENVIQIQNMNPDNQMFIDGYVEALNSDDTKSQAQEELDAIKRINPILFDNIQKRLNGGNIKSDKSSTKGPPLSPQEYIAGTDDSPPPLSLSQGQPQEYDRGLLDVAARGADLLSGLEYGGESIEWLMKEIRDTQDKLRKAPPKNKNYYRERINELNKRLVQAQQKK